MQKVLIIGGNSSVGMGLKSLLIRDGYRVETAGRKDCDIQMDIGNPDEDVIISEDTDVVVHAAAHFGGLQAEEILNAVQVNVIGTAKICIAAAKAGVSHLVLISSIFVLKEEGNSRDIYAISKKQSEEIAGVMCNVSSIPLTILRPSQIYGNTHSFADRQPFLSHIINEANLGNPITIYGSQDAKINLIHIQDLTEIISRVIDKSIVGLYHCAGTYNTSYVSFAKEAYSIAGNSLEVTFLTEMEDIQDSIFETDCDLYDLIGFTPKVNLRDGIKEIINARFPSR